MQDDTTYRIYVKWMATPTSSRIPKSVPEFLTRHNLTQADLFEFQEYKTFADDLNKETMAWAKRKTPAMLHLLYEKYVSSKNPADLRIWQDAIKYHEENQKQTSLEDLVSDFKMSENQLVSIAYRILSIYDPKGLLKPVESRTEPQGVPEKTSDSKTETIPKRKKQK